MSFGTAVAELSWARLVEVGLSHVDLLTDTGDVHEHWMARAPDGSSLVVVARDAGIDRPVRWRFTVYRPGPRPAGGTSSMREWVLDWDVYYDDAGRLLDDLAALAG